MDYATQLREHNLRATTPRIKILEVLAGNHHLDAEEIAKLVASQLGTVSTQTVYDSLAALQEAGLVRRLEPAGERARFELDRKDNHHHLICRKCRQIHDVACAVGHAPCLEAGEPWGYKIEEAEVIYWGLCPACQALALMGEPATERALPTQPRPQTA